MNKRIEFEDSRNWVEEKVETLARMLAAKKMGLIKDSYGENLPHELWSQAIPEARIHLAIVQLGYEYEQFLLIEAAQVGELSMVVPKGYAMTVPKGYAIVPIEPTKEGE